MALGICIIRVDASSLIGNGHLSRCLIIANYMRKKGWKLEFCTCKEQSKHIIVNEGFSCKILEDNESIPTNYFQTTLPIVIIADINSEAIFSSTIEYKKYIRILDRQADLLVTFEDLVNHPYSAGIVVIPYCGSEKLELDNNVDTKYLLGPRFFLLKDEFYNTKYSLNSKVENILITMGGSDPNNLTIKVLSALNQQKIDAVITLVIGGLSQITDHELKESSGVLINKIVIKRNIGNFAEIMSEADIAFTNSGLTKYELSAIGVPMIIISNTEEQAKYSKVFSEYGSSFHLGYHKLVSEEAIVNAYNHLHNDFYKRSDMSNNGKQLLEKDTMKKIYREIEERV
jgi:UDP-2,4-diacetamido-2,4,6-trideoxy-beta-L-altropyranose hydrolase